MSITDKMHDLAEHFALKDSCHDFEGMAESKDILALCKNPKTGVYVWDEVGSGIGEEMLLTRSLLLGSLHERADTFGLMRNSESDPEDLMTYDTVVDLYEMVLNMLSCRWWSIVTDEQIRQIEQQT